MLVVLSLSPRKPITRQPVLRFPKVVLPGTAPAELDAAYGLRSKGVVVEELARGGVIDFAPDALTREFAGVAELRLDPNTPVRVFRPTVRGGAELRPTLRANAEPPAFTNETNWHLGATRGNATGTIRWTGKETQSFVEFGLPGAEGFGDSRRGCRGLGSTRWTCSGVVEEVGEGGRTRLDRDSEHAAGSVRGGHAAYRERATALRLGSDSSG